MGLEGVMPSEAEVRVDHKIVTARHSTRRPRPAAFNVLDAAKKHHKSIQNMAPGGEAGPYDSLNN